jgi:hypothetical protein
MWFLPTKQQWNSWSLPSKLTAIGAYVGVFALLVTLLTLLPTKSRSSKTSVPPTPHLEAQLQLRISGFQIHVTNLGSVPANQVTVSLHTWQIGAPGPDIMTEYPVRDLAPNDDFTVGIRIYDEEIYGRDSMYDRSNQTTCGYFVVRSVNSSRPRAWAFYIPGWKDPRHRKFANQHPWPAVEFEYPQRTPGESVCIDYPPGACADKIDKNSIWRP